MMQQKTFNTAPAGAENTRSCFRAIKTKWLCVGFRLRHSGRGNEHFKINHLTLKSRMHCVADQ